MLTDKICIQSHSFKAFVINLRNYLLYFSFYCAPLKQVHSYSYNGNSSPLIDFTNQTGGSGFSIFLLLFKWWDPFSYKCF